MRLVSDVLFSEGLADDVVYAGGSTLVVLFEKGVVDWDEDLLINGRACLETLVRVGMGIGRSRRQPTAAVSS